METLGTSILNVKKKFLTFCYMKNKITLQEFTMKSCLEASSSEDLKDISTVILQDKSKVNTKDAKRI